MYLTQQLYLAGCAPWIWGQGVSEGGGSGEQAWNGEGRGVARLCQEGKEQGGRGTGPARSPCWLPRSGSTAVARDVGSFEGTVCW